MAQRRIILVSVVCLLIAVLTVQTLSRTPSSNRILKPPDLERLRNMTEEERKKEFAKMRKQRKLDREQRRKESEKRRAERPPRPKFDREQWLKEVRERNAEMKKEFLREKYALRPTEEQWTVIKAKLEKVQDLRLQPRSTIGLGLTSLSGSEAKTPSSKSRSVPTWKWRISWKDKAPSELTEGQRIAEEIIHLLENRNTTAKKFKQKTDTLRKIRNREEIEERKQKEQLSKAQQELREVLTTRQEAALVLMGRL